MAPCNEWCRGRPRSGDIPSLALWTPPWVFPRGRGSSGGWTTFPAAARLVFVLWILALVPGLFFLRKTFPVVFDFFSLLTPELTNDLGDIWVRQPGVFQDHTGLVMLAVKDEGYSRKTKNCYTSANDNS